MTRIGTQNQTDLTRKPDETPDEPYRGQAGSTTSLDPSIDTFIAPDKPQKHVFEEIEFARNTDGQIEASLNQKVIWIAQLQKGTTGSKAAALIGEIISTVSDAGDTEARRKEMAEFVLKLEAGGDKLDLDYLLRKDIEAADTRAGIVRHISAWLPATNFLWVGDDAGGDFLAALELAGTQPERVMSFIHLTSNDEAETLRRVKSSVAGFVKKQAASEIVSWLNDFPKDGDLATVRQFLLKNKIILFENYQTADDAFKRLKGDAPWLMASDIGGTATTGPRKHEALLPGFSEFVLAVNQTNPYLPLGGFDSFAYVITARGAGQEQDNLDLLKRLGRTLYFDNVSVRSGHFGDKIFKSKTELRAAIGSTKAAQIKDLLKLWSGLPDEGQAAILEAGPIFEPVYDPQAVDVRPSESRGDYASAFEQRPPSNTRSPIAVYGDQYPVIAGHETLFTAKFEYDKKLLGPAWDPDVQYKYVGVSLEDAEGNIYDSQGKVILHREAATGIFTVSPELSGGQTIKFKRDVTGTYYAENGTVMFKENVLEVFTDQQGHAVAHRQSDGTLWQVQHDAAGSIINKEKMRELSAHKWISRDGTILSELPDGSMFYGSEYALLDSHAELEFTEMHRGQGTSDESMALLMDIVLPGGRLGFFKSDDEGEIHFRTTIPPSLKNTPGLKFSYTVDGAREAAGSTKLYVQYVEEDGHEFKPVVLLDIDFLERLKPAERTAWLTKLKPLASSDEYLVHYYSLKDDSRRDHVEALLRDWGLPEGPLFYQDRFGFTYKSFESWGKRAEIRARDTLVANGLINGMPYVAMVTDGDFGAKAAKWSGIEAITQIDEFQTVLFDEREAMTERMEAYHHLRHQNGTKAAQGDLLLSSNRPYYHEVDASVVIDGPSARQAKLDAYRGLGKGDVIFYEIFEYNFDELGNDIFSVLEEAVLNGATLYFHYDDFGSRLYPLFENEVGFHKLKKLAKDPGKNGGKVYLINQPFWSDGGPNHVDHRKRSVIIRQIDWVGPDGQTYKVPVMTTEIAGRNIQESYFRNPPPSRVPNDYLTIEENDARYDASAWIYGQNFARDNISDMFKTMALNYRKSDDRHDWKFHNLDAAGIFQMIMTGGNEPLPEVASGWDYDRYSHVVARVFTEEYNVVEEQQVIRKSFDAQGPLGKLPAEHPLMAYLKGDEFIFDDKRSLATYYWYLYKEPKSFAQFALFDAAQSILIEESSRYTASVSMSTALNPDGYQEIYDAELTRYEALSPDQALLEIRKAHYGADMAGDWRALAKLEAGTAYENLVTLQTTLDAGVDLSATRQAYTAGYYTIQQELARAWSEDPAKARYEAYILIDGYLAQRGDEAIGRQKGAIDFIFAKDLEEFSIFFEHFNELKFREKNSGNYWVKQFKDADALAAYWIDNQCFLSPAIRERAARAAAETWQSGRSGEVGEPVPSRFANREVDNLFINVGYEGKIPFEEAYRMAFESFVFAERHLLLDAGQSGSIRLQDGRYYARLSAEKNHLMRTPGEIAQYKAALDFLALGLKPHDIHDPRRDPDNYYFEDIDGLTVNHEGANLYDYRNRRALFIRLQERETGVFFYANNYPPSRDVVDAFVAEKNRHPQKRIIYVVGPSGKLLDNVRRLAIKEMLAAGIEVWFMPNQEMHIKMGSGMLGSDNLDKGSLNNSEAIFHSFNGNYIDTITFEHMGPTLQNRAIPLHLIDPKLVDDVLGLKGDQMRGLLDVLLHQIEYT
jgi:hypothetical protein